MATPAPARPDHLVDQTRVDGAVSRVSARLAVDAGDADGNDRDLHDHLRRYLQSEIRHEQLAMGLRPLSFLRPVAMERVSGIGAALVRDDRRARQPGKARRLS